MKPFFFTIRSLCLDTLFFFNWCLLVGIFMGQSPPKLPEFKITKHAEYLAVSINGLFGGLFDAEGQLILYLDRFEPKTDATGKLSVEWINRELQVEVHLSPSTFKSIAEFMTKQVKQFEEKQKQQIAPVKMGQPPDKIFT